LSDFMKKGIMTAQHRGRTGSVCRAANYMANSSVIAGNADSRSCKRFASIGNPLFSGGAYCPERLHLNNVTTCIM